MSASASTETPPGLPEPRADGTGLRVAIAGFGTVGSAVARMLSEAAGGLRLTHVFNRDVERKRASWAAPDVRWTESFDDLLVPGVDVIAELVGGVTPAGDWVRRALAAGKSVVTANKQLIAHHGPELVELARRCSTPLRFEAAVGGVIPVLRAVQDGLAADRLISVGGILNGTCNYILSGMAGAGTSFEDALMEAQRLGLAEADPTDDVDGPDARAKLSILIAVAIKRHVPPSEISCRSIRSIAPVDFAYARRLGRTIRQVAWAELDESATVRAWVRPALVPRGSTLGSVLGSDNLILVRGERSGETAFGGPGAGGDPTAVAVMSDLITIARFGTGMSYPAADGPEAGADSDCIAPYYLRFVVTDRPGIVAALATALADRGLNIDAVLQEPGFPKTRLPFVVTLEPCRESAVQTALDELACRDFQVVPPVAYPILNVGEPS